jgi:TRAP-type mannitol/chloroaromatic compound transport system substrate-binding protein
MYRRLAVGVVLGPVVLALLFGTGFRGVPAAWAQQKTTTLKIQASWPSGIIAYDNLKMFAERVEKMSSGRLKIDHLPAGAVVGPFEVLDATHRGVIDGAHTAPGYWVGKHWAAIPLSHGPLFGMDYIDFYGWYYEGGGYELLQEYYQNVLKLKVVSFPIQPGGPQALGWFKRQIKGLEDFKGIKYRIYGLGADIFKEAGLSVVTLPGAEILPAAERGVIDGAEWVGGIQDLQLGFHNVWKIHYTPGLHEQVTVGDLLINKDTFDKLSPDLQEIIRVASKEVWFSWWAKFQKANAEAYKEMVEKHGVQVYRTPEDILQKFMELYDKLIERQMSDPFTKKVLESQKQYAGLLVPYRRSTWLPYQFLSDHYWKEQIFLR